MTSKLIGAFACAAILAACAGPPDPDADRAAAQLAAATRAALDLARNPGPLEVVCVAYSGDWEDPALPTGIDPLLAAYADGCLEVDGQLFARGGEAPAIWVGVGEPEEFDGSGAQVPVFTSTGTGDAASFRCRVARAGSAWVAEACQ